MHFQKSFPKKTVRSKPIWVGCSFCPQQNKSSTQVTTCEKSWVHSQKRLKRSGKSRVTFAAQVLEMFKLSQKGESHVRFGFSQPIRTSRAYQESLKRVSFSKHKPAKQYNRRKIRRALRCSLWEWLSEAPHRTRKASDPKRNRVQNSAVFQWYVFRTRPFFSGTCLELGRFSVVRVDSTCVQQHHAVRVSSG